MLYLIFVWISVRCLTGICWNTASIDPVSNHNKNKWPVTVVRFVSLWLYWLCLICDLFEDGYDKTDPFVRDAAEKFKWYLRQPKEGEAWNDERERGAEWRIWESNLCQRGAENLRHVMCFLFQQWHSILNVSPENICCSELPPLDWHMLRAREAFHDQTETQWLHREWE